MISACDVTPGVHSVHCVLFTLSDVSILEVYDRVTNIYIYFEQFVKLYTLPFEFTNNYTNFLNIEYAEK